MLYQLSYSRKPGHIIESLCMLPQLFYREMGSGPPVVVLHGLFGSGDNWAVVANALASDFRVILVDLRNHGRSFHHRQHGYRDLASDVVSLLDYLGLGLVTVVGHSMGGKAAMQLAHDAPDRVGRLIVVDILPMRYSDHHDHVFSGIARVPLHHLNRRSEADPYLAEWVDDPALRAFLIKGLIIDDQGARWRFNVDGLRAQYSAIMDPPLLAVPVQIPTTFIMGGRSEYVQTDGLGLAGTWFPMGDIVMIPNTGHWLHAENPRRVVEIIAGR